MEKRLAFGALCLALALTFTSCDLLAGLGGSGTPSFKETDYLRVRSNGSFKKIPSWIKGYWSDSEDTLAYSESYFFTDNNIFKDWIRDSFMTLSIRMLSSIIEDVDDDSYTVTFKNWYEDDSDYESHVNKDWILKFTKTPTGISVTETTGDTVKQSIEFTKGRLFLPTWLRNTTWASGNGLVELQFTTTNLTLINKSSGKSMDFTDTILPYIDGVYYEFKKGTGYIEEIVPDVSYSITINDGETTLYNSFRLSDSNTLTWTQGDSAVDMIKSSTEE